jgi:hypothetical protein
MANAVINRSTSGNGTALVAGVAGKRIYVYGYKRIAGGTVNAKFQSGDGTTQVDLEGACPLVANSGDSAWSQEVMFNLPVGKGLYLNLSGNVQVSGHLRYEQR